MRFYPIKRDIPRGATGCGFTQSNGTCLGGQRDAVLPNQTGHTSGGQRDAVLPNQTGRTSGGNGMRFYPIKRDIPRGATGCGFTQSNGTYLGGQRDAVLPNQTGHTDIFTRSASSQSVLSCFQLSESKTFQTQISCLHLGTVSWTQINLSSGLNKIFYGESSFKIEFNLGLGLRCVRKTVFPSGLRFTQTAFCPVFNGPLKHVNPDLLL